MGTSSKKSDQIERGKRKALQRLRTHTETPGETGGAPDAGLGAGIHGSGKARRPRLRAS